MRPLLLEELIESIEKAAYAIYPFKRGGDLLPHFPDNSQFHNTDTSPYFGNILLELEGLVESGDLTLLSERRSTSGESVVQYYMGTCDTAPGEYSSKLLFVNSIKREADRSLVILGDHTQTDVCIDFETGQMYLSDSEENEVINRMSWFLIEIFNKISETNVKE